MSDPNQGQRHSKISILFFQGCPNHRPTVDAAWAVVSELGLDAEIEEVDVTSPDDVEGLRFLGSPTVRVDGVDIEPGARSRTDYAMSCRLYDTPNGRPSREMLLAALGREHANAAEPVTRNAGSGMSCCATDEVPTRRAGVAAGLVATGGSVVAAIMSSACCWVPLLFVAFGASAAGVSAFLGPWRPVLVTVALAMLSSAFYFAYVRKSAPFGDCCSPNARRRRRFQRVTLSISALVVATFVFFPQYVRLLLGDTGGATAHAAVAAAESREVVLRVEGMHCEACAVTLQRELTKLDGVRSARVDYATRTARITASDDTVSVKVVDASKRLGYAASLRSNDP